jgi:AcrR family transcriptional regulator
MNPQQLAAKMARPRVADEREAEILDATVRVLVEVGYDRLTMDLVATEAHAGKATLYRHWSTKAELVVDAISRAKGLPQEPPNTGSLRGDLMAPWCRHHDSNASLPVSVIGGLMTAMHADDELATVFRERFLEPRWSAWIKVAERARERGEITEGVDLDFVLALLPALCSYFGAVRGQDLDQSFVERLIDEVVFPVAQRTSTSTRRGPGDATS